MKFEVTQLTEEMKSTMGAYIGLLNYRYCNLCVKAEPASLISIEGDLEGTKVKFEDLAYVALSDDFTFRVIPKMPDYIPVILAGVKLVHPEFKTELKPMEGSENPAEQEIFFYMPDVDDDRKKVLDDGVDTLGNACKALLDTSFTSYSARISVQMVGESPESVNSKKDELQQLYDWHKEQHEKLVKAKKEEIQLAWEEYKKKNPSDKAGAGQKLTEGMFKMKLN